MALAARRKSTPTFARLQAQVFSSRLVYDLRTARYHDPSRGYAIISFKEARQVIDAEIDASATRMKRYGREYAAGTININQWRDSMAAEIKLNHFINYAAGKGGFERLTPADYKKIEAEVKRQFKYLERFARHIDANPARAETKGFLSRVSLYAEAGRDTYEEARREAHREAGYGWERNVLHALESCVGCVAESSRGWQPIGTLRRIGRRICMVRCKCTFEFARVHPDAPRKPKFRQVHAKAFVAARDKSQRPAFLSHATAAELKNHRLFLDDTNSVGYGLDPDNDLQNVFNNSPTKGLGRDAINHAIRNGARAVDCYDGVLPRIYAEHGFVEIGRLSFSDEEAPTNWNYQRDGRPDIIFMAYRGGNRATIANRVKTFANHKNSRRYFPDWDSAKTATNAAAQD